MKSLNYFLILAWSGIASAQAFTVGASRSQLVAANGRPKDMFHGDAWFRKVPSNEFRIVVHYEEDDSQSRLHPVLRASSIVFTPDRNEPWEVLSHRIAELRDLCRAGCGVLGVSESVGSTISQSTTEVYICQGVPDVSKEWWQALTGSPICAVIVLEDPTVIHPKPQEFSSLKATTVELTHVKPDWLYTAPDGFRDTYRTSLGMFHP